MPNRSKLRALVASGNVKLHLHASERLGQRGVTLASIKSALANGLCEPSNAGGDLKFCFRHGNLRVIAYMGEETINVVTVLWGR